MNSKQSKTTSDGESTSDEGDVIGYGLTRGVEVDGGDARLRMRGVNVSRDGIPFSRVSRVHYDKFRQSVAEGNDDVLNTILSRVCEPGSRAWNNYIAVRTGVREDNGEGGGSYSVRKMAFPRFTPPWEEALLARRGKQTEKLKTYTLTQVLRDSPVREKYEIPVEIINTVATLAVTSPADAAATMSEYLNKKSPTMKIRVEAGAYSSGVAAAQREIAIMAKTRPEPQIGVPSEVVGKLLYMHCDADPADQWTVRGPLKYAQTVADVYKIAFSAGRHEVMHLFGTETAQLGIDIFSEDGRIVSSVVTGHSREPDDIRFLATEGLEIDLSEYAVGRFRELKRNVLPLTQGGVHMATALRFGPRAVVASQHVVETLSEPAVGGKRLMVKQAVASDLWAYKNEGKAASWVFREPVGGERACVMYSNGVDTVLSESFCVVKCDGVYLLSTLSAGVVPGMSGGAVVALQDMAILGVHCGQTQRNLTAIRVTGTMYDDLCEFVSEASVVPSESEDVEHKLRQRGLLPAIVAASKSLMPCYVGGECCGSVVATADGEVSAPSTVVGADGTAHLQDGRVLHFDRRSGSVVGSAACSGVVPVGTTRKAQLGESVIVVACDGEGLVRTNMLRVMNVGPHQRNFVIEDELVVYNVFGGLAVSANDGQVLGMVVGQSLGKGFFCVSLPVERDASVGQTEFLERVFPKMVVSSWDKDALFRALAVHEEGIEPMALMGRSRLVLAVQRALDDGAVPVSRWSEVVSQAVGDARLAKLFDGFGLERAVEVDGDGELMLSEAGKAKVLLALLYVAFESEVETVVDEWMQVVEVVPKLRERVNLVRRPSGFDVLTDDGRVLKAVGE